MILLASFILAYLIAAFPTAFLLAKSQGKDIFKLGSGSMGAMNTARNISLALGIAVLFIDVAKGMLAVALVSWLSAATPLAPLVASVGVVAGHAWSLYIGFRGGKALAPAFGAALLLYPWVGLAALGLLILMLIALKKRPNLAAVIAVTCFPLIAATILSWQGSSGSNFMYTVSSVALISVFILVKHLPNLVKELRPSDSK